MSIYYCSSVNRSSSYSNKTLIVLIILFISAPQIFGQSKLTNMNDDILQLQSFVDGIISEQLQTFHIAGATVSIVKDGNTLLLKGYGYSDIPDKVKVDAGKTIFKVGEISQIITTLSILQLEEKQRLSLNKNVNDYFSFFNIPKTFKEPVTLGSILTRTTGFENQFNVFTRNSGKLMPMNEYLKNNIPERIRPPDLLAGNSNYAMGLAGYVVGQITNEPFESYVEENIFHPLQMTNSSFEQPLHEKETGTIAKGYTFRNGVFQQEPDVFSKIPPSGSMSTTAADMTRLMITLLHNGLLDTTWILSANIARQMQHRHFIHDPEVSGNCYGFWEQYINDQRVIMSVGNAYSFHSLLALVPDFDLGIFISYNSYEASKVIPVFLKTFMDRYYPKLNNGKITPMKDFKQRSYQFSGNYWSTGTSYSTIGKLLQLFRTVSIHTTPKGYLLVHGLRGGPTQWVEIKPLVFQNISDDERLVFHSSKDGSIRYVYLSDEPTTAFYRIKWYESPEFHVTLVSLCFFIFLSFIIFWPFKREREVNHVTYNLKYQNLTYQAALWTSIVNVIFLTGLYIFLNNPETLLFEIPMKMKLLLILPIISAILTIFDLIFLLIAWKDFYWDIRPRIHFTLVVLAAAVFIPVLMFWNLLGFHY